MSMAPRARRTDLEVVAMEEETVVYDLRTDQAHCLNRTAAAVWDSCDGTTTPAAIAAALEAHVGAPVPVDVVGLALSDLERAGLLEASGEDRPKRLSRREVVRRTAGLAIALPLVTTLLAPTAASAASIDCSCSTPGDCIVKTSCPSVTNCNGSSICAP